MTKLISKIAVFEKLARAAQLRAQGAGPADRKPLPRPPLPPSTVMPEKKNTLEGKPVAKPLTEKEKEDQSKRMESLLGPANKKKDVAEKLPKEHIPSLRPGRDPSDKDLEVLERQRQDYFSRQQNKEDQSAAQRAESEKIKTQYLEFIKTHDKNAFIAYMKTHDPNFNAERYLKALREANKQIRNEQESVQDENKFVPNYLSGENGPTETSGEPSPDAEAMITEFVDELTGNDLDVFTKEQEAELNTKTHLPSHVLRRMLAEKGKFLLKNYQGDTSPEQEQERQEKRNKPWEPERYRNLGTSKIVVPDELIDRAAQMLDQEDTSRLKKFLADLPPENQPLSVNSLVEAFLQQTGFYNNEV